MNSNFCNPYQLQHGDNRMTYTLHAHETRFKNLILDEKIFFLCSWFCICTITLVFSASSTATANQLLLILRSLLHKQKVTDMVKIGREITLSMHLFLHIYSLIGYIFCWCLRPRHLSDTSACHPVVQGVAITSDNKPFSTKRSNKIPPSSEIIYTGQHLSKLLSYTYWHAGVHEAYQGGNLESHKSFW